MKIRKAQRKEADAIVKLLNSAEELKANEQEEYSKEGVLQTLKDPVMYMLVCEDRNKIIGVLVAEIWKNRGFSYMTNIVAHKDHRGKGCGSMLFERYEEHCRKIGLDHLNCIVRTNNKNMQKWSTKKGYKKGHALYYYEKKLD